MSPIRNLKTEYDGLFLNGKFDSVSLFQGEMQVSIFAGDGATVEDAVRCIERYNQLADNPGMLEQIQEGLGKFFLYMYDEWKDFGEVYGDIAKSLEPVMDAYLKGSSLIGYLKNPTLYVFPQQEGGPGYSIECDCPWEPEHQCDILIRGDKVLYVGPSEGLDPWGDESEYYCIWNDGEI